ncbi:MAG: hypothetical protein IT535_00160 [Bauldia sp.]|nr:hypothetical protein [Bauldia sp.]
MNRNATGGEASDGPSPLLRFDPSELPLRFAAALSGTTPDSPATVLLDSEEVVFNGSLGGVSFLRTVPLADYRGVAVRMVPAEGGELRILVELFHHDATLSLPLVVATSPGDVVADWQSWSKALRRPLILVGDDGAIVEPTTRLGSVEIGQLKPRRLHSFFASRRPRFLTRRKTGRNHGSGRIAGREIIAHSDR